MSEFQWILFLSQLPASPSSPRVMVWRRMRGRGAVSLQNGVWVLPSNPGHEKFLEEMLNYVHENNGSGYIFKASALENKIEADILTRFRLDRSDEYAEFNEQCQELLSEVEKESNARKFTFAELEENERNLERLNGWLVKIQERDFFKGEASEAAAFELARCRNALEEFARQVYEQEGC